MFLHDMSSFIGQRSRVRRNKYSGYHTEWGRIVGFWHPCMHRSIGWDILWSLTCDRGRVWKGSLHLHCDELTHRYKCCNFHSHVDWQLVPSEYLIRYNKLLRNMLKKEMVQVTYDDHVGIILIRIKIAIACGMLVQPIFPPVCLNMH